MGEPFKKHRRSRLTPALISESWRISAIFLIGISGVLLENRWLIAGFGGVALGYLGWHLSVGFRLTYHLAAGEALRPPFPGGLWEPLFIEVQRLQQAKRRKVKFSRFREAASALEDAVLILGEYGVIEWSNPAARRMLGLPWPKARGQYLVQLIRHPVLEEYLDKGDYSQPIEITAPGDKSKILSLRITPFGKAHHHLLVARDVTQIYLLNQAQQDFVANVSHELRTPLTVIMGFLENLRPTAAGAELHNWARSVELMESQAQRMKRIIDELLTLSRLQMKQSPPSDEPVPVPKLLASITQEARALSGSSAHNLTLEANPQLWLAGNHDELRSAFSNLIINAVQHTPAHAKVHIQWDTNEAGAHCTVTDTGKGIAARHIPRLTERFYRVDRARSRKSGGTGLGLAIVKQVLDRHSGELRISSEVGRGSSFSCQFPPQRVRLQHSERAADHQS